MSPLILFKAISKYPFSFTNKLPPSSNISKKNLQSKLVNIFYKIEKTIQRKAISSNFFLRFYSYQLFSWGIQRALMIKPAGQMRKRKILGIGDMYLRGQKSAEAMNIISCLTNQIIQSRLNDQNNILIQINSSQYKFEMDKYVPLQQIGKGSFGVVRKVKQKQGGEVLVWKQINFQKMSSRQKQQLVTQVNLLKELEHPNIVRYVDRMVDKSNSKVYIIMEYCARGDLGTQLKKSKLNMAFIEEEIIWKICYQLLLALEYCHNRIPDQRGKGGKVLHRDIKPANIFIDQNNHIKLGDFGLSRQMGEHSQFAQTHVGTPYYMSPQQVRNGKYNQKSDIWSTGCLIYQIAALRRPFEASNHLALAKKIEDGKFDRIPLRYSQNLFTLIKQMLMVDPQRRLSARQLLQNPMFVIRSKQNVLKEKIMTLRKREQRLREKQKQLELLKMSMNFKTSEQGQEQKIMLYKNKSSKEGERSVEKMRFSQKQNKNYQNLQNN